MAPCFAEPEIITFTVSQQGSKDCHGVETHCPTDVVHAVAFQTSVFQPRGEFNERRCERSYTSSAVGRAGAFQKVAKIATEGQTLEVIFKRTVADALETERLGGLYQAWYMWTNRKGTEIPLDNRELARVRRQAAAIARRHLSAAVSCSDSVAVGKALEAADAVANSFPYAFQATSSLEYAAARRHQQEEKTQEARAEEEQADDSDDESVCL